MSGNHVIIDSNIIIALFANDQGVVDNFKDNQVFVPSIVLGELYYGANKSAKTKENVARIEEFSAEVSILIVNKQTSRKYGEIKNHLKKSGNPIPENDIWISALSREHKLPLVTRDKHFRYVASLIEVIKW